MKKNLTRNTAIAFSILLTASVAGQQEVQNSLYMFNPSILNPAYAGSRGALSGVLDYRQQWLKWEGAPTTAMLCLHSPLKKQSVSLGLNVVSDKIGSTNNTAMYGDFAYRIRVNKRKFGTNNKHMLSFGLRAGGDFYSSNLTNLRATDLNDQIQSNGVYNKFIFNVGTGLFFHGKKHYIGFTVPKLLQNKRVNISNFTENQAVHYHFMAGCVFKINSMVMFKPSTQLKYTKNAPLSAEANASFLFMDKFWIGAMYRHKAAIGGNFVYQASEILRLGYSYDYTTTTTTKIGPGSHEIMIGFDMQGTRNSFKTPRYF